MDGGAETVKSADFSHFCERINSVALALCSMRQAAEGHLPNLKSATRIHAMEQ